MSDIRFTSEHEWIRVEGEIGTVGISNHAQEQLGDIVFVDLPEVGKKLEKGGDAAVVESVKAASEIYAPVSGEVTEVNAKLGDNPGLVNEDALSGGWFFRMKVADASELDQLMDEKSYSSYVESQE